jgi:hypothetical protein
MLSGGRKGPVTTPSGGKHFYVPGRQGVPTVHSSAQRCAFPGFPGVEVLSEGANVFLPGTRRPKYGDAGYQIVYNHLDQLAKHGDSAGADAFSEHPMQCQRQLDHPEVGAQVSAGSSHLVDQKITDLVSQIT